MLVATKSPPALPLEVTYVRFCVLDQPVLGTKKPCVLFPVWISISLFTSASLPVSPRPDAIPFADGLKIGASYFEFDKQGAAKKDQEAESGAYYATYTIGNVSLGYSQAYKALLVADDANTGVEYYDQVNQSISYAINDDLSVSYESEKSEANYVLDSTAAVEQKSTGIQIAYNLGGMTLALARNSHDNPSYSTSNADLDQTLLAVTMAF